MSILEAMIIPHASSLTTIFSYTLRCANTQVLLKTGHVLIICRCDDAGWLIMCRIFRCVDAGWLIICRIFRCDDAGWLIICHIFR